VIALPLAQSSRLLATYLAALRSRGADLDPDPASLSHGYLRFIFLSPWLLIWRHYVTCGDDRAGKIVPVFARSLGFKRDCLPILTLER